MSDLAMRWNGYLKMASVYRHGAEWLILKDQPANEWIDRGIQKTIEAEKINPDIAGTLALRSTLLKLKSRSSNDLALIQQATGLLNEATKRNPLLKIQYQD